MTRESNYEAARPVVAFVFQGGGSLSAPQVGMLRALGEAGITPDFVVGTSAGALNAVAFASDPTRDGVRRLEQIWLRIRRRHVAGIDFRTLARALIGRADGLLSASPLVQVLSGAVSDRLEDTVIDAHVVATEAHSGEAVVLSCGDSVPALLASAAIPGIYPPVSIDGLRLVDGGVVADVPVLQAQALGADICYVLSAAVSADADKPLRGPMAMAYRALGQILDGGAKRDIAAAQCTVHVLPAALSAVSNPLDFSDTRRLIEDGYLRTRAWLAHPSRAFAVEAVPA